MIGKGIIPKRIRERGVNDMKIKVVRSLLLVATVLSIGVSSVPVMAGNSDVGNFICVPFLHP